MVHHFLEVYQTLFYLFIYLFLSFCHFLGLPPRHMEVPRLVVQSELQPPAYARTTATRDPSCVCNLHHSLWQHRILNPLSKARDQTRNLMFLVGFVSTVPWWELQKQTFLTKLLSITLLLISKKDISFWYSKILWILQEIKEASSSSRFWVEHIL